ncbi:unnamed protein product, partial [Sphagnum compactum]
METGEKISLLLEQMRLTLLIRDFSTLQILSKKIIPKILDQHPEKKIAYYRVMVSLSLFLSDFISCTRHLFMIFEEYAKDGKYSDLRQDIAMKISLCIVLATFNNEQHDLLNRICLNELIVDIVPSSYKEALLAFRDTVLIISPGFLEDMSYNDIVDTFLAGNQTLHVSKILSERIVEHNIRIVSLYYERVTLNRLGELISSNMVSEENLAEKYVCRLVANKTLWAKIDRVSGIVVFKRRPTTSQVLNEWKTNVENVLRNVVHACHLISKDEILNDIA